MKSLLNALQEGRLVELPVHEKEKVLEYLAILIEAIPDIGNNQASFQPSTSVKALPIPASAWAWPVRMSAPSVTTANCSARWDGLLSGSITVRQTAEKSIW